MKQYTAWATASKVNKVFKKFRFPISLQISIFLIIVAFIPIAAMLVLKTYENQLLSLTESSNVQQARLFAASLSAIDDTEVSQSGTVNDCKALLAYRDIVNIIYDGCFGNGS